ncbi:hypothetical protein JCGZ_11267 [Jatropha curcas]|uniref:Uncharacterized protein n=1 Tax=Jatropha curcas TaxID=180498 RepID=A0A067KEX1_JATCU|nr:hypothetical protein JCGZ_11267 [Jatropha curcas]
MKDKESKEESEKKRKEKGKGKLDEIVEEEKKTEEKAEEEKEETQEEELEEERKEETEKESTAEKEESEKGETEKKKEPEKIEKGKKVEEGSDAETEKLEISDEEKNTEDKTEHESKLLLAQRIREVMLGRIEKELIEEHNKELDEAIQQCQTIIGQNQSLIKTLERMKDVNARKLATLRVKGTYIPSSEKPQKIRSFYACRIEVHTLGLSSDGWSSGRADVTSAKARSIVAEQQGNGGGATRWRSCRCRALRNLAESGATGCGARRSRERRCWRAMEAVRLAELVVVAHYG